MYTHDEFDQTLLQERVNEFRDQVKRRLSGEQRSTTAAVREGGTATSTSSQPARDSVAAMRAGNSDTPTCSVKVRTSYSGRFAKPSSTWPVPPLPNACRRWA